MNDFDGQGFTNYKRDVQALLMAGGWSVRGVFYALKWGKVLDAFTAGKTAWEFVEYVDAHAPLGMAGR